MPKAIFFHQQASEGNNAWSTKPRITEEGIGRIEDAIAVEKQGTDLYTSKELWVPVGAKAVYGGQIIAQSLQAAFHTVPDEYSVHSMHCYFVLPSVVHKPIHYTVQRLRDSDTFCTRLVTAFQSKRPVFVSTASFVKPHANTALDHQVAMPANVPEPDQLPTEDARIQAYLQRTQKNDLTQQLYDYLEKRNKETYVIESRDLHVNEVDEYAGKTHVSNTQGQWFKLASQIRDSPRLHSSVIAFASDLGLIMTAARANGLSRQNISRLASLDHAIWFHDPSQRADGWMFYSSHCPRTSNGRGIVFGRIFNRQGRLIATTAQEGLVRTQSSHL